VVVVSGASRGPRSLPQALTRPEEGAHPDIGRFARIPRGVRIDVDELLEVLTDVLRDHVLVDLVRDDRLVGEVDVDDCLDRTLDVSAEQPPDLHARPPLGTMSARYPYAGSLRPMNLRP